MDSRKITDIVLEAEMRLAPVFAGFDKTSASVTARILDAFREFRVDQSMFAPTDGYGYGDKGRDTLDKIYARVFGAEDGFVRHTMANGTHAIAIALWALLRPGDTMLSITGKPYDTLMGIIGLSDKEKPQPDGAHPAVSDGSLADFGIKYEDVPFGGDWETALKNKPGVKAV